MNIIDYTKDVYVAENLIKKMLSRTQLDSAKEQQVVDKILADVKQNRDKSLFDYTLQFDKFMLNASNIMISKEEIEKAYALVGTDLLKVIKSAAKRIADFHNKQKQNSWIEPSLSGEILGQIVRPIECVGVYVPGGKAAYPSSVLMNIIPAKIAGVDNIVMVTPVQADGNVNPATIVAAVEAGADKIFKVGGAQAIAALAYGTESIPKVDKIVGPGNIYVTLAKKSVFGFVGIDSIAGPSEILVIADESANPVYVAADMLSQAEHDELATAILVTTNIDIANRVLAEIEIQKNTLSRKNIIEQSLESYGTAIIVENLDAAATIANKIAPEHLELCVAEPFDLLTKIRNAGAVFLGHYTPEPIGDYMAGPNHVLPTSGTAKFFSPLSVEDFVKKSSVLSFSRESLLRLSEDVMTFAESEGLTAHANSIRVRLQ